MSEYSVRIDTEIVGDRKLITLYITHGGQYGTGISINDPGHEIPLIIEALERYLAQSKEV